MFDSRSGLPISVLDQYPDPDSFMSPDTPVPKIHVCEVRASILAIRPVVVVNGLNASSKATRPEIEIS